MPEEVEDCVDSVLEDNPDYSEDKAWAICQAEMKANEEDISFSEAAAKLEPDELKQEKSKTKFKARMDRGVQVVFKAEDGEDERFVIWGPASVEVVDKENDKITAEALEDALPQLLRRKRLSMEHSDQLVGDILESFETEEEQTVKFNGHETTRSEWPTDVLELDGMEPGLFVAGEIWEDTRQARKTREDIEEGEINSYSISGEAITTSTKVKDGEIYDEITELDLSAVTLCEEGMNEKAKFGTVTKETKSDDPAMVDLAAASSRSVAIVKTNTHMSNSDNDNEKSDEGERLELEDLRGELKEAASAALKDADFVTTAEVKSIVDSRLEQADIAETDAEDEGEMSDDETETETPDDPDEGKQDEEEEEPPEDEEEPPVVDEEEEVDEEDEIEEQDEVDPDEIEDPDDDGEEELDLDPTEDEEMPPEEEEDEKAGYTVEELQDELPDDLYEAVSEYLSEEEVEPEAPDEEEEVVEMEDDEDDEDEEDEEYPDAEKMDPEAFNGGSYVEKSVDGMLTEDSMVLPAPDEEETTMSKGAEDVDDEGDTTEKSEAPSPATAGTSLIYENDPGTQT